MPGTANRRVRSPRLRQSSISMERKSKPTPLKLRSVSSNVPRWPLIRTIWDAVDEDRMYSAYQSSGGCSRAVLLEASSALQEAVDPPSADSLASRPRRWTSVRSRILYGSNTRLAGQYDAGHP